jgi:hypothetical protein
MRIHVGFTSLVLVFNTKQEYQTFTDGQEEPHQFRSLYIEARVTISTYIKIWFMPQYLVGLLLIGRLKIMSRYQTYHKSHDLDI